MSHPSPSIVEQNSVAWRVQVWVAFVVSVGSSVAAALFLDVDIWQRSFMLLGLLFTVSSTLALAKTVRDDHEANKLLHRTDAARAEKLLNEFSG